MHSSFARCECAAATATGLAHVCEEFLVPALNILCARASIPADVAGATLLAAGCNAPEFIASIISIFVSHSTVGAGTVVGSAPFNLMCICGATSLAIGGKLSLDGSMVAREVCDSVCCEPGTGCLAAVGAYRAHVG